jgi:hypothetical protein
MRRALLVIATASLATALFAGGALAKGLTGKAKVEGKGLDKAITFTGDHSDNDGFWPFLDQTGVIAGFDGGTPSSAWKDQPPTGDLGPRYTITWDLEQFEGLNVHFVQYLYPYAEDGPIVYTPKGARIMQTDIPTGWWEAPTVLRSHLEARGLPENNPAASVAGAAGGAAGAAAESSSALPYVLLVIVITSVLAIGVVAARIRLRPAKAS